MSEKEEKAIPIWETEVWKHLEENAKDIPSHHLRDLLNDKKRTSALQLKHDNIWVDMTRQNITSEGLNHLLKLAEKANIGNKIYDMYRGGIMNVTEDRKVLHIALRADKNDAHVHKAYASLDKEIQSVWAVLDKIKDFSERVRNGKFKGSTGKPLRNVISIGIGGSYLGVEFVYEALRNNAQASEHARDRHLRFFANIDPIAFGRATHGLDPEETLCVVVSKTFTTRETMMNALLCKEWLLTVLYKRRGKYIYKCTEKGLGQHLIAVTTNIKDAVKFGVLEENTFEFWDWVGGRYSVCSAVGVLPLSLHYGFATMHEFLKGANAIDKHFVDERDNLAKNIPAMLGLFGVWNSTFLKRSTRALIPYCEALCRFPAHVQQLDMESNGKSVAVDGTRLPFEAGEIDFGEPGRRHFENHCKQSSRTNVKLLCTGRCIGLWKRPKETEKENAINSVLAAHKTFAGNRPSTIILFDGALNAYNCGQLLSIYEHRTAIQGSIWQINSFDQWGVELGKVLGKKVRTSIDAFVTEKKLPTDYSQATLNSLQHYLTKGARL
ncbi:glucose-6-phosphate isomerase, cytosolic (PGIC) [Reticulomyxa filosa]|uniref:Glucose-6-phosphate isomerase n=1 Tax=Reticulomyxa filosa TaxID=46433 RepID=X6LZX9_RETFI|nr:glucose-6-phosphate isomerase, cytosolic (PGIC) [Reticulomyxa filosa]|eukprot:ETO06866.1 glucose-6-phosphate isomerase, cytosolic (PGIC) [Reticulomyxa filosa]